jgi:hypothetical protein
MFVRSLLILSIISLSVSAQENKSIAGYDPVEDSFSQKYEGGPYLMYDCVDKHWVCVLESYYTDCEKLRAVDIENKKFTLGCAAIGQFPTKKACFQRQLYMIGQNYETRFCIHPDMQQKELKF